ncbi:MAG TPA: dihydrofolate reductase [Candidatus Nitrosocosmicus sp.]|nr:dihydrofolate reductase [Candidatus Nitrosocosmicus sp.]
MNIILAAVISVNGKITNGSESNISSWTSQEDKQHFGELIRANDLIIMGSNTYEAAREKIVLDGKRLRIVLTQNPEKYTSESKKGELEFSAETPDELIHRMKKAGYTQALLVSGSLVTAAFLKAKLITEVILTVEPYLFGNGKPLLAEEPFEMNMELMSMEKLNEKGTLLLKYRIT